jgi:hypothetical protein
LRLFFIRKRLGDSQRCANVSNVRTACPSNWDPNPTSMWREYFNLEMRKEKREKKESEDREKKRKGESGSHG